MTTAEKLDLYSRFDEGTELGDGVRGLIPATQVLNGIGCDHEVALVVLVIEKLIRDYMEMARARQFDWDEYSSIDAELYAYMLGGARKLTEEEYNADTNHQ
jgi:hypothetical protein